MQQKQQIQDVPREPVLYARREGARLLGISVRKFDELVQEKRIRVCRIGTRVLVSRRSLEKFASGR